MNRRNMIVITDADVMGDGSWKTRKRVPLTTRQAETVLNRSNRDRNIAKKAWLKPRGGWPSKA